MPGPVEGKGEVNSPEMQVGTVLISGTPCIRWIRRMTESVLLARLEFFGSEAKDKRGLGKTVRGGKSWDFGLGVVFLILHAF